MSVARREDTLAVPVIHVPIDARACLPVWQGGGVGLGGAATFISRDQYKKMSDNQTRKEILMRIYWSFLIRIILIFCFKGILVNLHISIFN